jgi:hypothetical protein
MWVIEARITRRFHLNTALTVDLSFSGARAAAFAWIKLKPLAVLHVADFILPIYESGQP